MSSPRSSSSATGLFMTMVSWIPRPFSKCLKPPRRCQRPLRRNRRFTIRFLRRRTEQREDLVVLAPSSKISGTIRSAQTAAQEFPGLNIRFIDTLTISCNLGSLVLVADDMAKAGKSGDEIESRIKDMLPRGRLYFVVDTLEYLAKGGRIGGARALLGELIRIKPILAICNGQAEPYEQQRTRKRSLKRLVEIVEEQCPKTMDAHLSVLQVAAEGEARSLAADLKTRMSLQEIPIYELPPAITVHGGPKAMGVGFFV